MESAAEYLARTESASHALFAGIDSYIGVLKRVPVPVFVGSIPNDVAHHAPIAHWLAKNEEQIRLSLESQKDFSAESFALATLCGCLLQIAAKGIEWFSGNIDIPVDFAVIKPSTAAVPFCIGRRVRGVPIGLVIYAGRNQFAHLNERNLREPNATIFERLALNHGHTTDAPFKDPAFDLQNAQLINFSRNIIGLLEWRTYDAYSMDMQQLLGSSP